MIAVLLVLALSAAAAAIGAQSMRLFRVEITRRHIPVCLALGFGVIAYTVLAVGMCGRLSPVPVALAILVLAGASWRGALDLLRAMRVRQQPAVAEPRWLAISCWSLVALLGVAPLLACFVPPGGHEWDVLSYHLAVPRLHIVAGTIGYVPTIHHSNFPFLVQTLFTVGLLFQGHVLAALLHFALAASCAAATADLARRHFHPQAGPLAALVFWATPIVLWEAGIAYIDVAQALYVSLAVGCTLDVIALRGKSGGLAAALMAGVLMGFALGVKTLSLVPVGLMLVGLVVQRVEIRQVIACAACALVLGAPFYVRTAVLTGNPVYPFAFNLFGGRDWSAGLAATYATEHRSFGYDSHLYGVQDDVSGAPRPPYEPPSAADRARNLILAPFGLISTPRIFYNANDAGPMSLLGFLFLALPAVGLFARERSHAWRICGLGLLLWLAVWSVSMQYVRYLIPMLPILAAMGSEALVRLVADRPVLGSMGGCAVAAQLATCIWVLGPRAAVHAARLGDPGLNEARLVREVNVYPSQKWLNEHAGPGEGVVLFEDTRGFYLERRYLWGNQGHSTYIPYDRMRDGADLAAWFRDRGYRWAIVNLRFSPFQSRLAAAVPLLMQGDAESLTRVMRDLYSGPEAQGERWRALLGDAISRGMAVVAPEGSGAMVVLLEFRGGRP